MALAACAPRPLLERAIRARGGPLGSVVRTVEGEVHAGFTGHWRWRIAWSRPDRLAWTIETATEPIHFLFDGAVVRSFVGGHELGTDAARDAPLRSHARFLTVLHLDALRLPGAVVRPLAASELPAGVRAGLAVALVDDGAQYRLGFDERDLLVWAVGPVALPPLGAGDLTVRFADFRRAGGFRLPRRATWSFGDAPLADEHALAVCPAATPLPAAAFRSPAAIPGCGVRGAPHGRGEELDTWFAFSSNDGSPPAPRSASMP